MKLKNLFLFINFLMLVPQMVSAMGAGYYDPYDPWRAPRRRAPRRVDADQVFQEYRNVNIQASVYQDYIADLEKKVKALDAKKTASWNDSEYIRELESFPGEINNVVEFHKAINESITENLQNLATLQQQEPSRESIDTGRGVSVPLDNLSAMLVKLEGLLEKWIEQVIAVRQDYVVIERYVNERRAGVGLAPINEPASEPAGPAPVGRGTGRAGRPRGGFGAPAGGGFGGPVGGGFGAPAPAGGSSVAQTAITATIVAAIVTAITTYIGRRNYQKKKNMLIKKYALGSLTPLQNSVWMATALAAKYMPWYLRYLVRNKTGSLTDFIGDDPRAVAELYYGHTPSKQEVQTFLAKFFEGVK